MLSAVKMSASNIDREELHYIWLLLYWFLSPVLNTSFAKLPEKRHILWRFCHLAMLRVVMADISLNISYKKREKIVDYLIRQL